MNRMPSVIKAEYRGGYRIHVTFDDNSEKTIDCRRWLKGPVFAPLKDLKSFDTVRTSTLSNIARGRRSDKGFHYVADIDMSIQNVEANLGWRNALHLARKLGVPIHVTFEWRQKVQASHPGEQGSLTWVPSNP